MTERVTTLHGKEKAAPQSTMQTIELDATTVNGWTIPPFQRPLRINDKVRAIAEKIADDGGVVPGVLTVGRLKIGRELRCFIVDGQHRLEALRMSGVSSALADVRFMDFLTMADMADEFVACNSRIVNMRPDDVLRGMEASTATLLHIRKACPFVGYDMIRRNSANAPMVSMSATLRVWEGSAGETPVAIGRSAMQLASDMTHESADGLVVFLTMAFEAWGRDEATKRLWGTLNLALCMWLWRRLVIDSERRGTRRYVALRADQFRQALMSLGAASSYTDWLEGRQLGDRDRSSCYTRIRQIFARRLLEAKAVKPGSKVLLPAPPWAKN